MKTFVVLLCLIILPFASINASAQEAVQTDGPIAAQNGDITDSDIAFRIRTIFGEIDGLNGIFVTVRSGVVTLRGRVSEAQLSEQAVELASRVEGVVAVTDQTEELTSLDQRLEPVAQRLSNRFWQSIHLIPLFSVAILSWALVYFAGHFLSRRSWPISILAPNAFIAELLRQIIRIAFFVAGLVLALDIIGATALLGTILGAAGIVGLAIGFAVRDTVENYIASILLSIRQPFRPKDFVEITGHQGFVTRLTSRATILIDPSGNHIRIPNSTVFKADIINYSRNPLRRFDFDVGVASDSNLNNALETGLAVIDDLDFVLDDPKPEAWIEALGDSNIVLRFVAWIDQTDTSFVKGRSEAMRLTKLALEDSGVDLPEPIYRVVYRGEGGPTASKTSSSAPRKEEPSETHEVRSTDDSIDDGVTQRVDEERTIAPEDDLLNADAPDELGG